MLSQPVSDETDPIPSPAVPRLRLFGPMRADFADGRSFLPRHTKTRAVLAVLALAEAKPVARDVLVGLLWPTRGREQAQASLRQSLHELRSCLAPLAGASLTSDGNRLILHMDHVWIDAIFVTTPDFLASHAVDTLRGPLLIDLLGISDALDSWIVAEQRCLSDKIRSKFDIFLAGSSSHHKTIELAEAVLAYDIDHEAAWMALARCHGAAGDSAAALDVYHRCLSVARKDDGSWAFDITSVLALCLGGTWRPESAALPASLGTTNRSAQHSTLAIPWRAAYLAVAPIRAIGDAPRDLAMCVDWQILAALYKFEELSCSPISPVAEGEGAPLNIAKEGFDFLLEGYINRDADRDLLALRLRDLNLHGEVIWSQQTCRMATNASFLEADFAIALAPQIAAEIFKHQAAMLENCSGLELNLCKLVLKASRCAQRLDRQGLSEADTLLTEAIKRDPRYPALLAWSAFVKLLQLGQGWFPKADSPQRQIGDLIDRGLSFNPQSASILAIAGHVLAFTQNRLDEGLSLQERALSKNPNLPSAWLFSGLAHTYAGRHKEAIDRLQRAKRLSPADQQGYFIDTGLSFAYLLDGNAGEALDAARAAIRQNPNFSSAYKLAVSASGYISRGQAEPTLLKRLLILEPSLTVERLLSRNPLTRSADQACLAEGLRVAGLPR